VRSSFEEARINDALSTAADQSLGMTLRRARPRQETASEMSLASRSFRECGSTAVEVREMEYRDRDAAIETGCLSDAVPCKEFAAGGRQVMGVNLVADRRPLAITDLGLNLGPYSGVFRPEEVNNRLLAGLDVVALGGQDFVPCVTIVSVSPRPGCQL
jgi:hypothetical protein